jgi:2-(1,2-epoxy-1,2-dihydrophenyl)acetyl-CoA isomerase
VSLHLSIDDGIGQVVLSRPEAMNSLTIDLIDEIGEAFASLRAGGAHAAVLAGEGRCFCAGADLSLVRAALQGDAPSILAPLVDHLHAVIRQIRQLPFPVVAAVEGPAVGAGMGLALSADLRVVGMSAKFVPGYLGIGASPDGGVSYFLARSLGAAKAASIVIRNRPLGAEQLLADGLADEIVDDGTTLEAARALAHAVASTPPLALMRTRQLIDQATTQDLDHQLDLERELVSQLWDSHDFTEGVTAFLEKRPPLYEGR